MKRPRLNLPLFLCACLAASVAGAATNEITEPFQGVRLIRSQSTEPRLVDMWIVEIDMSAPGLEFFVTPSNGTLPGDTTPQTTRAFATLYGTQLAINASFFSSAGSGQYNVEGLSVSNGHAYSGFQPFRIDALNVSPDNVATIIQSVTGSGIRHTPATILHNAVGGDARLVTNGINTANAANTAVHPRTAAGVTADGRLLLFTVDGRNPGHSGGLTISEMADVLIRWGARDAINLDGGGSTTLVMDNPGTPAHDPQVINIPSDQFANGQPGRERAVANNFGVFAAPQAWPAQQVFVFADFEQGDQGTFHHAITFSGSNRGFLAGESSVETIRGEAYDGQWSQRLVIFNDPNADGGTLHPGGAWFLRHVSGGGNPANNISRPAIGSLGLWARTTDPDLRISLVVDDASGLTGERGLPQEMIADGQWHPYFWDLADARQWEGWVNGDGVVEESFTLDSIQIFGPPNSGSNLDAVVYIDAVTHLVPGLMPGDFNGDGVVDSADYTVWRDGLGASFSPAGHETWKAHFGASATAAGTSGGAAVPEPASLVVFAWCGAVLFGAAGIRRRSRRRSVTWRRGRRG